jgi:hypothetical protein
MNSFGATVSTTEEPDAGKLHVRVCTLSITHKFFDTHVNLKSYQTIFVDRAIHA